MLVTRTSLCAAGSTRRLDGMRVATILVTAAGCGFQHGQVPAPDSRPVDANVGVVDAAFDTASCPSSYDRGFASSPRSRYRIIAALAPYRTQHIDCADDATGWTHLATIDDAAELSSLIAALPGPYTYVGGVQLPSQPMTAAGWQWLTGAQVTIPWATSPRVQPEDGDMIENDGENITLLAAAGLHDETGVRSYPAICECDGIPIDPSLAAVLP